MKGLLALTSLFALITLVFLKLQPYCFHSLARKPNEKLSPRFYGPYEVLERVGTVAYRLKLPDGARLHPVFHISQLKKQVGTPIPSQPLPTCLKDDLELDLMPENIVDRHFDQQGSLTQVLVKRQGYHLVKTLGNQHTS